MVERLPGGVIVREGLLFDLLPVLGSYEHRSEERRAFWHLRVWIHGHRTDRPEVIRHGIRTAIKQHRYVNC